MRTLILAAALAAGLAPIAAQAQWIDRSERAELRRDRADLRDERRDLDYAYRYGDRRDIRDAEREYRDAKHEYRQDWRDAHRDYRAPYYTHANGYRDRAPHGMHWVYRGPRALLIDRRGRVVDVRPRYWR